MVSFEVFVRPAILKMMGRNNLAVPKITAIMEEPVENDDGRRFFARVVVRRKNGKYFARLTGPQGSGILTSMTKANGLAVILEGVEEVKSGSTVEVMMFDWDDVQF
jgi:molybdopterin molybdotransferase